LTQVLGSHAAETADARTFWWALGDHDFGEREILGCWRQSSLDRAPWLDIACDLEARGVERVRVAFVSNEKDATQWLNGFLSAGSATSHAGVAESAPDLSPRLQRGLASSVAASRSMRMALARVFRRQRLENEASSFALLDRELQRLDRMLWSRPDGASLRSPQSRRSVPTQVDAHA